MNVIVDMSIPAGAFPLGRVLEDYPDVEIELERLVPLREAIIPLFWVDDGNADGIEATIADDPLTESVKQLTQTDSRVLYEIAWDSDMDGLIGLLMETDARILEAEGTANVWDFRLQFRSRNDLVRFRDACEDHDIPLTLRRLYNPTLPEEGGQLSDAQHDALVSAQENGYFEVPRGTSMGALADGFGISDSAFSQRLRRGTGALIAETLLTNFRSMGK